MRRFIKFPLLVLFGAAATNALLSPAAIAGRTGVTLPGSGSTGVADTFAPGPPVNTNLNPNQVFSSRINNGLLNTLRTIEQRTSVLSLNGQTRPISTSQIAGLASSLSGGSASGMGRLEQQLASEIGSPIILLSPLGNSPRDLQTAINSANDLIMSLNSAELDAAIESPTFLALLELLEGGKDALASNTQDPRLEEAEDTVTLVNMTLADVVEVTPEPATAQPQLQTPAVSTPQAQPPAPSTEPGFQEPVRGLW